MRLFVIVILAVLSVTPPGWTQSEPSPVELPTEAIDTELQRARTAIEEARYAEALPLAERILETVEAIEPVDEVRLVEAIEMLAKVLFHLGHYAEVEEIFMQAIQIREARLQALGRDADYDEVLALGDNYVALATSLGARLRLEEAIDLLWRGVQLFRDTGETTRAEADLLMALYQIYLLSDREAEAKNVEQEIQALLQGVREELAEESEEELEIPDFDLSTPDLTTQLAWQVEMLEGELDDEYSALGRSQKTILAFLQEDEGKHDLAETTLRDLLDELVQTPDAELERAYVESQLAGLYVAGNHRFEEAQNLYESALQILEKHLGPEHYDLTFTLNGLGRVHQALGRFDEAEKAFRWCLKLRRQHLTIEHPFVAHSFGKLVFLYGDAGRPREDYAGMLGAAYGIYQRNFANYPDFMKRWNVASLDRQLDEDVRRAEVVHPSSRLALELIEKQRGPDHPDVADHLAGAVELLRFGGRHTEAESRLRRIVEIRRESLGDEHPMVAVALHDLAESLRLRGRSEKSLPFAKEASQLLRDRLLRMGYERGEDIWRQQISAGNVFRTHLRALADLASPDGAEIPLDLRDAAFEVSQLAISSRSAIAIARLASRFDDGEASRLARRHQDMVREYQRLGEELVAELARPSARRTEIEERLTARRAELKSELARLSAELQRLSPEYAELAFPRPIRLVDVQDRMLRPREALVLFVTEQNTSYMVPEKSTYIWWITRDAVRFHRSTLAGDDLDSAIRKLREQLDPGAGRGGDLLRVNRKLGYDFATAHALYEALLAPFADDFDRVDHVVVVPDGPLISLPLAVLVEAVPDSTASFEHAPWLADRFGMSVVPSVGSLALLRSRLPAAERSVIFLGIGAPNLSGTSAEDAFARAEAIQAEGRPLSVKELRSLSPLPEAEGELRRLAIALDPTGASNEHLLLHDQATESRLRSLDLERYSVLAFATHGLMAGEFDGLSEPALVLTPPKKALSSDDDGLLTASEITALRLRADWVILSACNTAASDGTPNADGFSGLARAFLYAGSQTLLVSHWYVLSEAAAMINARLFEILAEQPAISRAEALRLAMRDVRQSGGRKRAHPRFWAPFVLVGDGA